jgi:TolB protein
MFWFRGEACLPTSPEPKPAKLQNKNGKDPHSGSASEKLKPKFLTSIYNRYKTFLRFDNDGFWLNTLTLLALLVALFLFFFEPSCHAPALKKSQPEEPVATAEPTPAAAPQARPQPRPHKAKPAYIAVHAEYPMETPVPVPTSGDHPQPTPVPPGGGYRSIAFVSNRGDGHYYQLYMMDSNGNNVQRLTRANAFDRNPHFSYDGNKIAFSSNRGGGFYQIFILDLQTKRVQQMTSGDEDKTNPIWVFDNSKIFYTVHGDDQMKIMQMNSDGSEVHQIRSSNGCNYAFSVSPDGNLLAYQEVNRVYNQIVVLNLTTREKKVLIGSDDVANYGNSMFAPNGWQLLFTADFMLHHTRALYIYDLVHGTHERVISDNVDRGEPLFSPDGSMIAYTAKWGVTWNIWVMNADGGNIRNLTKSNFDNMDPTWR